MKRITKKVKVYETKICCYDEITKAFHTIDGIFLEKPTKPKVNDYLVKKGYGVKLIDVIAEELEVVAEMSIKKFITLADTISADVDPERILESEVEDNE